MKKTIRYCVNCGVRLTWRGDKWVDPFGARKCDGEAKGHKPDNKLREGQKKEI